MNLEVYKKVAILGSRVFDVVRQHELEIELAASISKFLSSYSKRNPFTLMVSGGAYGVDSAAELAAEQLGLSRLIITPKYNDPSLKPEDKVIASLKRNDEIVAVADIFVFYWNGEVNSGTHSTIMKVKAANKPYKVFVWDAFQYKFVKQEI